MTIKEVTTTTQDIESVLFHLLDDDGQCLGVYKTRYEAELALSWRQHRGTP